MGIYWLLSNGLGSIAFVATCLIAIWVFGLRDKFEGEEGMSAYNVFNKGGQAIMGGFTGEQLEEQMRGSVISHKNRSSDSRSSIGNINDPLVSLSSGNKVTDKHLDERDKLKRRSAAAAAAELRIQQQQQR